MHSMHVDRYVGPTFTCVRCDVTSLPPRRDLWRRGTFPFLPSPGASLVLACAIVDLRRLLAPIRRFAAPHVGNMSSARLLGSPAQEQRSGGQGSNNGRGPSAASPKSAGGGGGAARAPPRAQGGGMLLLPEHYGATKTNSKSSKTNTPLASPPIRPGGLPTGSRPNTGGSGGKHGRSGAESARTAASKPANTAQALVLDKGRGAGGSGWSADSRPRTLVRLLDTDYNASEAYRDSAGNEVSARPGTAAARYAVKGRSVVDGPRPSSASRTRPAAVDTAAAGGIAAVAEVAAANQAVNSADQALLQAERDQAMFELGEMQRQLAEAQHALTHAQGEEKAAKEAAARMLDEMEAVRVSGGGSVSSSSAAALAPSGAPAGETSASSSTEALPLESRVQDAIAELQELTERHLTKPQASTRRPSTANAADPTSSRRNAAAPRGGGDARNDMARNVMRKLYKRNVELEKSVHLLELRVKELETEGSKKDDSAPAFIPKDSPAFQALRERDAAVQALRAELAEERKRADAAEAAVAQRGHAGVEMSNGLRRAVAESRAHFTQYRRIRTDYRRLVEQRVQATRRSRAVANGSTSVVDQLRSRLVKEMDERDQDAALLQSRLYERDKKEADWYVERRLLENRIEQLTKSIEERDSLDNQLESCACALFDRVKLLERQLEDVQGQAAAE